MRKGRIFAAIFIFILTMLLTRSIYFKTQELYGNVGYERFSVRLKGDSLLEDAFDKADAEELERILAPELMTYYAFNKGQAASERSRAGALICGIKGKYNEFYNMRLRKGSFLNEKDHADENYVTVIDEKLAEKLFGSADVIGLDIYMFDKKFKIIGITGDDLSIAGRLIQKDLPYAYVPLSIMEEANQGCKIPNIELKAWEDSLDKALIEDKIALIGRNPDDFYIEDWNELGIMTKQRFDILFFVMGIYCICCLLIAAYKIFRNFIELSKSYLRDNYFSNMIKDMGIKLLTALGKIAGILTAVILIWKEISFDLYISPESFPEDPMSMKEIFGAVRNALSEFIKTDNSYILNPNLVISFLSKQGSLIFMLSLLCELYILLFIMRNISRHFNSDAEAARDLGLCFGASILLSFFIIHMMGLTAELPVKTIILLWAGFFAIAVVGSDKYTNLGL